MRAPIRPTSALVALAVATVIAVVGAASMLLADMRARDLGHATDESNGLGDALAEQTTRLLQSVDLVLMHGVRDHLLEPRGDGKRRLDEASIHELLNAHTPGLPYISSIFVIGADGHVVASSRYFPAPRALWLGDRPYFVAHATLATRGLFTGAPVRNRVDQQWALYLSRRLETKEGRFLGVIVAALKLGYFEELYATIRLDDIHRISLLTNDGVLVASQPRQESLIGTAVDTTDATTIPVEGGNTGRLMSTYRRVPDFPLLIKVDVDTNDALRAWWSNVRFVASGMLLVVLFIGAMTWLMTRRMNVESRLAKALAESEQRLRALIDSAMDAIVAIDHRHRIVLFNPAAEHMFGHRREEVLGKSIDLLIPERLHETHRHHVSHFGTLPTTSRPKTARAGIVGQRADGSEFPIESTISKVEVGDELLLTAILRDVSDRQRAEEELRRTNRQLRHLSASLQTVREQERTRIARELHDELGQQLTRLKLDLSWVASRLEGAHPALPDKIASMKAMIDDTVASVRRITAELRPLLLDDLGFAAAAKWLLDEFARRTGTEVMARLGTRDDINDGMIATALFRILQESLNNVTRHAQATRVDVVLRTTEQRVTLIVVDNGRGIMRDRYHPHNAFGLLGVRERTAMLGGRTRICGRPGRGTLVAVSIPLPGPKA